MSNQSGSELVDAKIGSLNDWRGDRLSRLRQIILKADERIVEEIKWRKPSNPSGVPVWSCNGIICTGESYKDKVKLTFPKGAKMQDPAGLFNASLNGNARRAIDIKAEDSINEEAFSALIQEAIRLNTP